MAWPARGPASGNASSLLRLGAVTTLVFEHEFSSQQATRIVRHAHQCATHVGRQLRRSVFGRDLTEVVSLVVCRLALLAGQCRVHLLLQCGLRLCRLLAFGSRLGLGVALRCLRLARVLAFVAALAFASLILRALLVVLFALAIGARLLALLSLLPLLALLILALLSRLALLLVLLALAVFLVVLLVLNLLLLLLQ